MKNFIILICFLGLIGKIFSQEFHKIPIDELTPNSKAIVFLNYHDSKIESWYEVKINNKNFHKLTIEHEGKQMNLALDNSYNLLSEETIIDEAPVSITFDLDYRYKKYKILSFGKMTDFVASDSFYRLLVTSKKEGIKEFFYDELMMPISLSRLKPSAIVLSYHQVD